MKVTVVELGSEHVFDKNIIEVKFEWIDKDGNFQRIEAADTGHLDFTGLSIRSPNKDLVIKPYASNTIRVKESF